MKTRLHRSIKAIIVATGIFFASSHLWAETVEISTAEITMQDLDLLHPGGGTPKTALVTPPARSHSRQQSTPLSGQRAPDGPSPSPPGRTIQGGDYGILFNTAKDGSGSDLRGTLTNGGTISAKAEHGFSALKQRPGAPSQTRRGPPSRQTAQHLPSALCMELRYTATRGIRSPTTEPLP